MDTPRLDAWSLHCLSVFVREQNVTRAGAVLGLSQPAASSVLARLRTTFADPLLVKSPSGMVATPRAIELKRQCEQLLNDMRAMLESKVDDEPMRFEGSVTIAAIDMIRALLMPDLMALLAVEAPGITVRFHEADQTRIHEHLENGTVDLGIGPSRVSSGRMHYKELWVDHPVLMTGHSSLSGFPMTTPEQICSLQNAVVHTSRPSFYDHQLDQALVNIGLRRKVAVVEKSYLTLPTLLERCPYVAVMPSKFARFAAQRHDVCISSCPLILDELSVGLYWHEKTHRSPMYQWIREQIANCTPSALGINQ